ncbi:hypothetical protein ACGFIU_22145 [Rhodococcus oryzae]|uniref:hypothetical protein n=1 Tax=Rhodococcus oryzae TaxID=2571143 RepID=UPI00371D2BC6
MNVSERLAKLRVDGLPAASDEVISQDLERGRMALRSYRFRRGAVGVGATFAVAAAAFVGFNGTLDSAGDDQQIAIGTSVSAEQSVPVRLVAYTGEQLQGFIVGSIPEGYVLQGSTPSDLVIARQGDQNPGNSYIDKIVVSLQSKDDANSYEGTQVTVKGQRGAISEEEGTRILEYTDGKNALLVQVWKGIELTDAQIVALAEGVTVTSEAVAPVG